MSQTRMESVKSAGLRFLGRLGKSVGASDLSFDFLTLHYMYIIGMTMLGSLLIFAGGGIRYINALFLASSCCTQAGLATLNINDLNLWQQVCMFLLACFTNPIVIHSATAFVRLYWFQKRFAHIVKETNMKLNIRRTKSRTFSAENEERGVAGREIRVLFDSGRNHQQAPAGPKNIPATTFPDEALRRMASEGNSLSGNRLSFSSAPSRKGSGLPSDDDHKHVTVAEKDEASNQSASFSDSCVEKQHSTSDPSSVHTSSERRDSVHSQAVADDDQEETKSVEIDSNKEVRLASTYETAAPEQARPAADIRFAELPIARKNHDGDEFGAGHSRSGSMSAGRNLLAPDMLHSLRRQRTGESTMLGELDPDDLEVVAGNEAPASAHRVRRRRASSVSRFGGRTATLERAITTALRRRRDSSPRRRSTSRVREATLPYISFQPTVGRNSAFTSLSKDQRAELGGIEYRATKTLCKVLVTYFFGFHIFGFICFLAFIYTAQQYIPVVNATGASRGWWSIFTSASCFNDLGLTLTPDSFVSFENATYLLLIGSFLIVIGNTGFPCMLRFYIWLLYRLWPGNSPIKEEFAFLLDHPRRCFTLLFPSSATWWLFAVLVGLNGLDLLLFIVLDLGNDAVTNIPVGYRIVDGLFQAFCTRTAGFSVVNLAALHSAILVSYMIMMYISVFPVAISIRRTNVYEERSLGIYSAHEDEGDGAGDSFIGTHVRQQLGHDLWYVFLALFIICIIENPEIENSNLQSFNIFNVLFEIVSAYGTVGLSIGFPGVDYSFSGQFHTLSKLVIIALQIRGRHRGLPLKLDRAVLLPSEKLSEREEEDAELRLGSRSVSRSMARATSVRERQD